jgi:transcriptional regulator with XRE-family HTH domain
MTRDQVGLTHDNSRRLTPGLRRQDVAVLAGISIDYYTRLEQGKECHPSDKVLRSLAQVFQLDMEATRHLYRLARPWPCDRGPAAGVDKVDPTALRLMDCWDQAPAFVVNHRLDVLARNPLSAALNRGLRYRDNLIRLVFGDPAARTFYRDWEQEADIMVAHLRTALWAGPHDPTLPELAEELSLASEDFRRRWVRHDVGWMTCTHETRRFRHRDVGDITLRFQSFTVNRVRGQQLIVAQASPGSRSEDTLASLSMLATSRSGVGTA